MKCRKKTMTKIVAFAALLLALAFSPAVVGQDEIYDPYGNGAGSSFEGDASGPEKDGTSNSATWSNFYDAPLGSGLLVLALSGVCYAGAKKLKAKK